MALRHLDSKDKNRFWLLRKLRAFAANNAIDGWKVMRLWGRKFASNPMKVFWYAEEINLDYEFCPVDGPYGSIDPKLNPHGRLPVLEDDGAVLWESNTILRYLAERYDPDDRWWPADPLSRAMSSRWMDWQLGPLRLSMSQAFKLSYRPGLVTPDMPPYDVALAACARDWLIVDAALNGQAYMGGAHPTLADIVLGLFVHRWVNLPGAEITPNIRRWYEHLLERPPYAKHIAIDVTISAT